MGRRWPSERMRTGGRQAKPYDTIYGSQALRDGEECPCMMKLSFFFGGMILGDRGCSKGRIVETNLGSSKTCERLKTIKMAMAHARYLKYLTV